MAHDFFHGFDPPRSTTPSRGSSCAAAWRARCCRTRASRPRRAAETPARPRGRCPTVSEDGLTWTFTIKDGIKYGAAVRDVRSRRKDFVTRDQPHGRTRRRRRRLPLLLLGDRGLRRLREGRRRRHLGHRRGRRQDPRGQPDRARPATCRTCSRWRPPPRSRRTATPSSARPRATTRTTAGSSSRRVPTCSGAQRPSTSRLPIKDQNPARGTCRTVHRIRAQPVVERRDRRPPPGLRRRDRHHDRRRQGQPYNKVEAGEIDFVVDGAVPPDKIQEYQTTPDLQDRMNIHPSDAVRYTGFNLAMPPFDDVHVRKAVNWAFDKEGLRQLRGGPPTGEIAGHIIPNRCRTTCWPTTTRTRPRTARATSRRRRRRWRSRSTTATATASVTTRRARRSSTITDRRIRTRSSPR